jgi:hypothetical protein
MGINILVYLKRLDNNTNLLNSSNNVQLTLVYYHYHPKFTLASILVLYNLWVLTNPYGIVPLP